MTSQRVVTSVTPAEGQNDLKFNRYHEEQLKKKLSWVKIVLFIGALVLGLTGGGSYLMGDLSAKAAGTSTAEDEALEAMEEAGSDAEANAIRKQEQAEARDTLRKAGQHLKVMALVQLLLAGAFITMIFLTNSFPFEISLAALLLYIGLEVWSVASEGELPSLMGCLIIVVIAGNLAAGVHAGWQIRTLRAAK